MDASDNRFYREKPPVGGNVLIDYTNHAGVVARIRWRFGATEWHPEPQWLLDAYDLGKDDVRTFAVEHIHRWSPRLIEPVSPVDASIAKQLQASMELNARMKNRLAKFRSYFIGQESIDQINAILADEEPTWPPA